MSFPAAFFKILSLKEIKKPFLVSQTMKTANQNRLFVYIISKKTKLNWNQWKKKTSEQYFCITKNHTPKISYF